MKILGPSTVSLEAARAWAAARGAHQRFIDVAWHYWNTAPRYGIPPEIPYAQAAKETNWGKYTGVVAADSHNWCGLKTKKGGSNSDPKAHQQFPDAATGVLAHIQHLARYAGAESLPEGDELVDPRWDAVTDFTPDVEGLGGAWAPSRTYGNEVATRVADLRSFANDGTWNQSPTTKPRVALAAGHHNTSGGNRTEHEQVGRLTPAIAAALRARGVDVHMITPDDGRGDYDGTLSDVARQVTRDDAVFLEVHTEGNNSGDRARGVFAIYPDWGNDVDTDVRDTLGPALVQAISGATGLPIRGTGLMSEKATGVGSQGYRLGVFGATEPLRASLTRLIVEYGSHSSPADMALWNAPGFVERAAGATADAIAQFLGIRTPPKEPQDRPPSDALHFPETGYSISGGFRAFWEQFGALPIFGYPITGEYVENGVTIQYFERARFEWHPGSDPERFDVMLGLLGYENRALQERIDELEAA